MRYRRTIVSLMTAAAIVMGMPTAAYAGPPYSSSAEAGSILKYVLRAGGKAVDGAEITLYKAADLQTGTNGNAIVVPMKRYESILQGKSLEDITKNARSYAEKMSGMEAEPYKMLTTDKNGEAVFENVPDGCYLVRETNRSGTASSFGLFEPSVIIVPELKEDGTANRTIEAAIKVPLPMTSEPSPASEPSSSDGSSSLESGTTDEPDHPTGRSEPEDSISENDSTPATDDRSENSTSTSAASDTATASQEPSNADPGGQTSSTPSSSSGSTNTNRTSNPATTSERNGATPSDNSSGRRSEQKPSVFSRIVSAVRTGDSAKVGMLVGAIIVSASVIILLIRKQNN